MGLNAVVYCDCYEKDRIRFPPPQPELVYVADNGQVCLKWDAVGADQNAFYNWLKHACDHPPLGELLYRRLGNVARIASIRRILADSDQDLRVLLTKVVYDGTHAGDWLTVADVVKLQAEMRRLTGVHALNERDEAILRHFEQQISELVAAATLTRKPIAF